MPSGDWIERSRTARWTSGILRLRQKVEKDPANPRIIHSVRGFGYSLEPRAIEQPDQPWSDPLPPALSGSPLAWVLEGVLIRSTHTTSQAPIPVSVRLRDVFQVQPLGLFRTGPDRPANCTNSPVRTSSRVFLTLSSAGIMCIFAL